MKLTSISEQMIDPSAPQKPGKGLILPGQEGSISQQIERSTDIPKFAKGKSPRWEISPQDLAKRKAERESSKHTKKRLEIETLQQDVHNTEKDFEVALDKAKTLKDTEANVLIAKACREYARKMGIWSNAMQQKNIPHINPTKYDIQQKQRSGGGMDK